MITTIEFYSLYLFVICLVLALLEIQIEGPHGWAAKLPTWRCSRPWLLRFTGGRPLTGYHLALTALLLLFMHFPLVVAGWSREREALVLSSYFLMNVLWDFLWFVFNPAYGLARFRKGNIWWFRHWLLGFPTDYYFGLAASFVVVLLLDTDPNKIGHWLSTVVMLGLLTGVSVVLAWSTRPRNHGAPV